MRPDIGGLAGELHGTDALATVQLLDRCRHRIHCIKEQSRGELQGGKEGRRKRKVTTLCIDARALTCRGLGCNAALECSAPAASGQRGVNPSLEWHPDYSIRSLGKTLIC